MYHKRSWRAAADPAAPTLSSDVTPAMYDTPSTYRPLPPPPQSQHTLLSRTAIATGRQRARRRRGRFARRTVHAEWSVGRSRLRIGGQWIRIGFTALY